MIAGVLWLVASLLVVLFVPYEQPGEPRAHLVCGRVTL